jgi:tetratricopeptide (TPR) repeat protein
VFIFLLEREVSSMASLDYKMSRRMLDKAGIYFDADDIEKALDFTNRSIDKDPHNPEAHFVKGNILMAMEESDRAIQSFDIAISFGYKDEIIYTNRGIANKELGKFEKAFSDYALALKCNKKFGPTYANRGELYLKNKYYINAINEFDIALKFDPDDYYTLKNRCSAYAEIGNSAKALEDFEAFVLSKQNGDPDLLDRGYLYSKCGYHEKAILDFSKLIDDCPFFLTAYELRLIAYEKLGQVKKAKADRDKIDELKGDNGGYISQFIGD